MIISYSIPYPIIYTIRYVLFGLIISSVCFQAKAASSRKDTILSSPPPKSSVYAAPARSSRMSLLAIGNHLGSGAGLEYEKIFTTYLHLTISGHYTQALLKGVVSPDIKENLTANTTRMGAGLRFFLKKRFYIGSRLNASLINGTYSYEDLNQENLEVVIPFQSQMLSADLYVGHEFLLAYNLHIGVDWVGFGLPLMLATKDKASDEDNQVLDFLTQQTVDERVELEITEQIKLFYLTIHFGYRF